MNNIAIFVVRHYNGTDRSFWPLAIGLMLKVDIYDEFFLNENAIHKSFQNYKYILVFWSVYHHYYYL